MAERVVELLEPVEVELQQREPARGALAGRGQHLELAEQRAAVGQAGQVVGQRLAAMQRQRAHLAQRPDQARQRAGEGRGGQHDRRVAIREKWSATRIPQASVAMHAGEVSSHQPPTGSTRPGAGRAQAAAAMQSSPRLQQTIIDEEALLWPPTRPEHAQRVGRQHEEQADGEQQPLR